jgi:hypothetical protein
MENNYTHLEKLFKALLDLKLINFFYTNFVNPENDLFFGKEAFFLNLPRKYKYHSNK